MGAGMSQGGMYIMDMFGVPGYYAMMLDENSSFAQLIMLDYEFMNAGCETFTYLTDGLYSVVAGSVDSMTFPQEGKCLVADPGYVNFTIGDKTYFPVVPETEADAEGNPYGVTVTTAAGAGQDLNLLEFNLPAVDEEGNSVVIKGSYLGELGYTLGGGATQTVPFVMSDWGFDEFQATKEGSVVTLRSQSMNGNLVFKLDLSQNNGVAASEDGETWMALEDGSGSLNGYFWEAMDDVDYKIVSGQFLLQTTATPGVYKLVTSPRNPVKFQGPSVTYVLGENGEEYEITVTGLE